MKVLAWFLALALIPVVFVWGILFALNHTLINSQFLKTQLAKADVYTDVVSYLPGQLLAQQSMKENERAQTLEKIQAVITPDYLKQQVEGIIDQAVSLARGKSSILNINISGVMAKLKTAGLPSDMTPKPIIFSLDQQPQAKMAIDAIKTGNIVSTVLLILLLLVLLLLSWRQKLYSPLVTALFIITILEIALVLLVKRLPSILVNKLPSDNTYVAHFLPKIQLLTAASAQHITMTFSVVAGIACVVAVLLVVLWHLQKQASAKA